MVVEAMAGAEDTIYLCNFRVSVDGDWLCLKELAEGGSTPAQGPPRAQGSASSSPGTPPPGVQSHRMHARSAPSSPMGGAVGGLASLLPPSLFAPYTPICYGPSHAFTPFWAALSSRSHWLSFGREGCPNSWGQRVVLALFFFVFFILLRTLCFLKGLLLLCLSLCFRSRF